MKLKQFFNFGTILIITTYFIYNYIKKDLKKLNMMQKNQKITKMYQKTRLRQRNIDLQGKSCKSKIQLKTKSKKQKYFGNSER